MSAHRLAQALATQRYDTYQNIVHRPISLTNIKIKMKNMSKFSKNHIVQMEI